MKAAIKTAFGQEMSLAKDAYKRDQLDEAFRLLERAHILGQRYFTTHFITHWWMLKVGIRKTDWREVRGQVLRIIAVIPGYLFGWVPKGNTGGADVSALKPMPIPSDLAAPLKGYSVWTDVLVRVFLWAAIALLIWFGAFAWSTYVRAGETRTIVSAFDGSCRPLVGFQGPEDLVWDREAGLVYAVGGDRRSFRAGGPGRAKIWALSMASPELAVPNDLAPAEPEVFRSFGMDLHVDEMGTRRLFVANRPNNGHTIEIFRVTSSGDLTLERTLRHHIERAFSKRRQAIEEAAKAYGYRTPKGMELAALRTRQAKRPRERAALFQAWSQEARALGFKLPDRQQQIAPARSTPKAIQTQRTTASSPSLSQSVQRLVLSAALAFRSSRGMSGLSVSLRNSNRDRDLEIDH